MCMHCVDADSQLGYAHTGQLTSRHHGSLVGGGVSQRQHQASCAQLLCGSSIGVYPLVPRAIAPELRDHVVCRDACALQSCRFGRYLHVSAIPGQAKRHKHACVYRNLEHTLLAMSCPCVQASHLCHGVACIACFPEDEAPTDLVLSCA